MSDALPEGIHNFLGNTEWEGAEISPLVGDASFRRYFRLRMGGKTAMHGHAFFRRGARHLGHPSIDTRQPSYLVVAGAP